MSRARRLLLFAALLLLATEAISLSLGLQRLRDRDTDRAQLNRAVAASMLPRVAGWVRSRGAAESTAEPWLAPFDELRVLGERACFVNARTSMS